MPVFVDTNVLVYSRDTADPTKHAIASEWIRHLWETGEGRLSIQVLQEYYVTTTRKLQPGLSTDVARANVEDLSAWCPVVIEADSLRVAWSLEDRFGFSFWDSLIIAAAHMATCDVLLTEDLQHEVDIDGVRILDPFRIPVGEVH